jgi:hypothetical protein
MWPGSSVTVRPATFMQVPFVLPSRIASHRHDEPDVRIIGRVHLFDAMRHVGVVVGNGLSGGERRCAGGDATDFCRPHGWLALLAPCDGFSESGVAFGAAGCLELGEECGHKCDNLLRIYASSQVFAAKSSTIRTTDTAFRFCPRRLIRIEAGPSALTSQSPQTLQAASSLTQG